MDNYTFVVVGGGIAGVSCVETLAYLNPNDKILLVTESSLIKAVTNLVPLGKAITKFDVEEQNTESLSNIHKCLTVIHSTLRNINSESKIIETECGTKFHYKYLCICTGGKPKLISEASDNKHVIGIRDTESVQEFQDRVQNSKRLMIVGNGGIASELVHEIEGIEIIWVVKDKHISATFVDPGAAEFFQSSLSKTSTEQNTSSVKRMRYQIDDKLGKFGPALGPDWHRHLSIKGNLKTSVKIIYETEVESIQTDPDWNINVLLTNGEEIGVDFLVSATGVIPHKSFDCDKEFKLETDSGISVDWKMETSVSDIFAAGDVCSAAWHHAEHWFQMRLWSQARQMGMMAGKSMSAKYSGEEILQDFCFEIFTHVTNLFGYQVVLLGKYNGQGFGPGGYEILMRMTPNMEYIKFVLVNNKLQGAVLIGDTGLEETCENLVLNQLDLSSYGDDLLNPNIDIEDYFD